MDRMKEAVQNWANPWRPVVEATAGANLCLKQLKNDKLNELRVRLLKVQKARQFIGGGGRSRTYDAADMSRVL